MYKLLLCAALTLAACKPQTPRAAAGAPITLHNDQEKTLYALGLVMGQRMGDFSLTGPELAIVQRGVADQVTNAPKLVELRDFGPRIGDLAQERQRTRSATEKTRGREFADRAAREAGARRLPSGLVFRELAAGTGPIPSASDTVRVHYRGTLIDGSEFDSSRGTNGLGPPTEFPLNGVIPCWTEGVGLMHVGGRARLVCPSDIAYGDRGQRGIPPGATLNFEVELVGIVDTQQHFPPPLSPNPGNPDAAPVVPAQ